MKKINSNLGLFLVSALFVPTAFAFTSCNYPVMPMPCFSWNNFYIGAEGGATIATDTHLAPNWNKDGATRFTWTVPEGSLDTNFGTAAMEGVKLGYHLNQNVAVDLAYNHRGNFSSDREYSLSNPVLYPTPTIGEEFKFRDIQSNSLMFDLTLNPTVNWCGFTPYVSAGIGVARNEIGSLENRQLFTASGSRPQTFDLQVPGATVSSFAWQAGVGVDYAITCPLHINLGYRYVDLGKFETADSVVDRISGSSGSIQPFEANHVGFNEVYAGLTYNL